MVSESQFLLSKIGSIFSNSLYTANALITDILN